MRGLEFFVKIVMGWRNSKFKVPNSKSKVKNPVLSYSAVNTVRVFCQIENATASILQFSNSTLTGLGFINISPVSLLPIFHRLASGENRHLMVSGAHS
jgi:hypothetical protein